MGKYRILTDSNSDMVPGYAKDHDVVEVDLTYTMDDQTYFCNDPALSREAFYAKMREGKMPITAQVNIDVAKASLAPLLENGEDVICLIFSSALSGTYNSIRLAAEELGEQYPARKIIVIDTLAASAGQGLLVRYAVDYKNCGFSIEENAEKIQADIPHLAHLFTVNDLFHLHRGGRVSKASAVLGSMLSIKPVLHVDDHGKLVAIGKVRGRKASLLALVDEMEKRIDRECCSQFLISHGDCLADAQFVAEEVQKRFGIEEHAISFVGPTIGAHSGPGTVALFFYAKHR